MYLNTLSSANGAKHNPKRLGRGIGSCLGKTSGRGHKGQKSRSGCRIRRGFEGGQTPLYRRLPKFGFRSNKSKFNREIRLHELSQVENEIINLKTLKSANIIDIRTKFVKIILTGKINRAITVLGLNLSRGARAAIQLAGGKIEE